MPFSTRASRIRRDRQNSNPIPDARDVVIPPAPPASTTELQIDLKRAVDPVKTMSLQQQVLSLTIVDRDTHGEMLNLLKAAKQLYRIADDHWKAITRRIDAMKGDMLQLAEKDRGPLKRIITEAEQACQAWTQAEERRVRLEQDRLRQEAEAQARADRERELAEAEAAALELEAQSPKLSAKESDFCKFFLVTNDEVRAAKMAGYQKPAEARTKLMSLKKVQDYIASMRAAAAVREQARAVAEQPITAAPVERVEAQTAKVAGIQQRMYYRCEVVDEVALFAAFIAGTVPPQTFVIDQSFLDKQATALKEDFAKAFPGCRLVKTPRIAG